MATISRFAQILRLPNPLLFALLLTPACFPRTSSAQDAASTPQEVEAPVPAVFHNPIASDQLAFLNNYAGRRPKKQ
jgi:hypothetical protein